MMLGREIPIESMQDMEIRLRDITGKAVLIRERVAVSSMVNQPILCFGRLLENGWCVDGQQQALTHMAGAHVPIELQNKSIVVQGEIRMLREEFQVIFMCVQFKLWTTLFRAQLVGSLMILDVE